jgi:hypothetical protein
VNLIAGDLVDEREVILVGKKRFVGRCGKMILQDV